jgi:DNA-binding XRE family transcriptional regulator
MGDSNKLGNYLRGLREDKLSKKSVSQQVVADAVRTKKQNIEMIENGKILKPNPVLCLRLAEYYGVPVEELINKME